MLYYSHCIIHLSFCC